MNDKFRMVTQKLGFLQGNKQNENMLDLKLSFILNDGMMIDCEAKLFTESIFVLTWEEMQPLQLGFLHDSIKKRKVA